MQQKTYNNYKNNHHSKSSIAVINQDMIKKSNFIKMATSVLLLGILSTAIHNAFAADLNNNNGNNLAPTINSVNTSNHKNPFTKPVTIIPNNLPRGLPNDIVLNSGSMSAMSAQYQRDMNESPEAKEDKFQWTNMRIVGLVNDTVLLRVEDSNNSNSSNGGSNNNSSNNNSNNSNGSSNNNTIITIMATINEKFFFNKNYYTLKKEKNAFVIFNKNNIAMHSLILESSAARLIPKNTSSGASGGGGSTSSPSTVTSNSNSVNTVTNATNQGARCGTTR